MTSVATPITDIGRAAADQLVARLEGSAWEAFQEYPVDLVCRASTAPPAHREAAAQ